MEDYTEALIELLRKTIEQKDGQIEELRETIVQLQATIADLSETLEEFRRKFFGSSSEKTSRKAGEAEEEYKKLLGHESIQTTEIYLRVHQGSVSKILKEKLKRGYRMQLNNRPQISRTCLILLTM